MNIQDKLLAVFVVTVWGITFFFMRLALNEVSPMVLGILRFLLLLFPAVFLLPRPNVRWYWLASYGLAMSFGQFSLLFISLHLGMPTGLAALLHQGQVFLTILLAAWLLHEPIRRHHMVAMMVAAVGLACIGIGQHQGAVPAVAMLASFGAATAWAAGNIVVKKIGQVNALSLVVWGNMSSLLAFSAAAVWLYGLDGIGAQIWQMSWRGMVAVAFLAYMAGLLGYAAWGALLARYMPAQWLNQFLPVVVFVCGLYMLFNKMPARVTDSELAIRQKRQLPQGLLLGFYDGVAGPGTGAFWTVSTLLLYPLDLLRTTAVARSMNFVSNAMALAMFAAGGQVMWTLGMAMGLALMLGAVVGSRLAIKGGSRLIRPLFILMVMALTLKLAWQHWFAAA